METTQRRHFSRIHFHGAARVLCDDHEYPCEVLDLSLKGALLRLTAPLPQQAVGQRCLLELALDEGDAKVHMEGDIAHQENGQLGLSCREIDLDSITHLRRLLELNLGDAELLHREFAALVAP